MKSGVIYIKALVYAGNVLQFLIAAGMGFFAFEWYSGLGYVGEPAADAIIGVLAGLLVLFAAYRTWVSRLPANLIMAPVSAAVGAAAGPRWAEWKADYLAHKANSE